MDEQQISDRIAMCKNLKFKFQGIFAADNFPLNMIPNTFCIVNAATSDIYNDGHWVLLCRKQHKLIFADPLGLPIELYESIYKRMMKMFNTKHLIEEPLRNRAIQSMYSDMCGLYCIYLAHYMLTPNFYTPFINDYQLSLFDKHMIL